MRLLIVVWCVVLSLAPAGASAEEPYLDLAPAAASVINPIVTFTREHGGAVKLPEGSMELRQDGAVEWLIMNGIEIQLVRETHRTMCQTSYRVNVTALRIQLGPFICSSQALKIAPLAFFRSLALVAAPQGIESLGAWVKKQQRENI